MRKLFTVLSAVMMALVLSLSASAQGKVGKATRNQMSKAPAAVQVDRNTKVDLSSILPMRKGAEKSAISSVKPLNHFVGKTTARPNFAKHLAPAALPNLQACVIFGDSVVAEGMYTIPDFDPIAEEPSAMWGGCLMGDNKYMTVDYEDYWIMQVITVSVYDTTDWSLVSEVQADYDVLGNAYAYDPVMDCVYGVVYDIEISGLELATINPETGKREITIGAVELNPYAMAVASDGTLYAIDQDGAIYTVDKTSAEMTKVGDTGIVTQYIAGGTIDRKTDVFYYAPCLEEGSYLYAIDINNGFDVSCISSFAPEVSGMFVAAPLAEDAAPSVATDLTVSFEGADLVGNVSFIMPAVSYDGAAIEGELSYTVYCNGEVKAEGKAEAGDEVTAEVEVWADGNYTFYVVCSNAVGNGPKSQSVTTWIGQDVPMAPEAVELAYADGVATVTWTPVTESVHGGYFDAAAVTYKVIRLENWEETVVAEGLTSTSFTEEIAEPEEITMLGYKVMAQNGVLDSDEASSNTIALGSIVPPFEEDFEALDALNIYTIIDGNNDGKVWTMTDGQVRMTYNTTEAMDDWMITPAIELVAGKAYDFTLTARSQSVNYPERIEVMLGDACSAEAMTATVIEPTILADTMEDYVGTIAVAESGKYYIGIHGISDADKYYLYVDGFAISAPYSAGNPAAVADLAVTTDAYAKTATLTWTNPTKTVAGSPLAAIEKVEVLRDNEVVASLTGEPGAAMTYTDTCPEAGTYVYSVIVYNAEGAGKEVSTTVFVGIDLAAAPEDAVATEWANAPGKVTISWTPVAKDINGNDLNPEDITYTILDADTYIIAEGIAFDEAEYTYEAIAEGEQDFMYWYIIPKTEKGLNTNAGGYAVTAMIPVGTPYAMPFKESIEDGSLSSILAVSGQGSSYVTKWSVASSCSSPSATPQDGDGGMLSWWPIGGDLTQIVTGKIHIDESENVAFSFYYHSTPGKSYEIMPIVKIGDFVYDQADEWTSTEVAEGEELGWVRIIVPMVDYIGSDVQVGYKVYCYNDASYCLIDNIQVAEVFAQDLAIKSINGPVSIQVGKTGVISTVVVNDGLQESGAYTVNLLKNGEIVESVEGTPLASGAQQAFVFEISGDLFSDISYIYQTEIVYAEDENTANNISDNIVVRVAQSMLPAVEDLDGKEISDGMVYLYWSAPDTSASVEEYVDDVEDYEAYAIDQAGDWTFIDVDASGTYGFQGIEFPGNGAEMAFMVFDQTIHPNLDGMAHSGDKAFACFAAENAPNDDWMISPALPGIAQTVSFFARSWMLDYGAEKFEFYYSTESPSIADMQLVDAKSVGEEWTEFSFDIPEGAKYFAIRCVSNDAFIFLVDDISFAKGSAELEIVGYDIYRNEEKINDEPWNAPAYFDQPEDGTYTYYVVTVYTTGESALSNPYEVTIDLDGINSIDADAEEMFFNIQGIRVDKPQNGTFIRVKGNKVEKVYVK